MKEIILISILGGIINLDFRTFGKFLFAQPIFAATLTGLCLGEVSTGFVIGIFLELMWINLLPEGAVTPLDGSIPAVLATTFTIFFSKSMQLDRHAVIVLSLAISLPFGFVSRWLEIHLKQFFTRFNRWIDVFSYKGMPRAINLIIFLSVFLALLKGFLLCFVPLLVGLKIVPIVIPTLPMQVIDGLKMAYWLIPLIGLAVTIEFFSVEQSVIVFFLSFGITAILFSIFDISRIIIMIGFFIVGFLWVTRRSYKFIA